MKRVCGVILTVLWLFHGVALAKDDSLDRAFENTGLDKPKPVQQSYVEGQVAAAEVFQVSLPNIKYHTEDGIRQFTVTIESTLGEVQEQWLEGRLRQLRREGGSIEFAVVGSDITTSDFAEAKALAEKVKHETENVTVNSDNIEVPKQLNYQRQKLMVTIISATVAGANTMVGVLIGANMPFTYMTLMAGQASLMSGVWTHFSDKYSHWISRHGILPKADARKSGHLQSFIKQWSAVTIYLYLMKQAAALTPIYTGVTNPMSILTDAAFIGIQGLFSRFFYRQAINYRYDQVVDNDPRQKERMELWRMRTSIVMSVVFGLTEQLANFHVPGASYALMGLGFGGIVLYKYVTSLRVKDIFTAIVRRKIPLTAIRMAGTCSFLFFF